MEEAALLGEPGSRSLAFLVRPSRAAVGAMVLCSSLYHDLDLNNRTELMVARALAARGFATVRFHYRGTGNSEDIPGGAVTFDSMVADGRTALSWLVERTAVTRPFLCGFRLGALVAAELARGDGGTPLVLWAPMANGAEYYRGLSRASMVAGVRAESGRRQGGASAEQQLAEQDSVEMLGNVVHRASYDDLRRRSLPPELGGRRRILVVQVGLGDGTAQQEALVAGWTAAGAHVEILRIRMRQLWMIPDAWEPEEESPTTQQLVAGITDWAVDVARGMVS